MIDRCFITHEGQPNSEELVRALLRTRWNGALCLNLLGAPTLEQVRQYYHNKPQVIVALLDDCDLREPVRFRAKKELQEHQAPAWARACDAVAFVSPCLSVERLVELFMRIFSTENLDRCQTEGRLPWVEWFEDNPTGSHLDRPSSLPKSPLPPVVFGPARS